MIRMDYYNHNMHACMNARRNVGVLVDVLVDIDIDFDSDDDIAMMKYAWGEEEARPTD